MTNPTHGQSLVQPDDVIARIDSLIPADEVHSHPLVWRARNIDLALLIDARNEIKRLRARVEVLETALRYYADDAYNGYNANGACARAALETKP
jgi:hypothetical protein